MTMVSEAQALELDALRSIYCKDGEFLDSQDHSGWKVEIKLDLAHLQEAYDATNQQCYGSVEFLLPSDYPQMASPSVSVNCPSLHKDVVDRLQNALTLRASEMQGDMVLLNLICLAKELLEEELLSMASKNSCENHSTRKEESTCLSFQEECVATQIGSLEIHSRSCDTKPLNAQHSFHLTNSTSIDREARSTNTVTALLHLDHMRSKSSYTKLIKKWAGELNLAGRLFFCQRTILILLQGDAGNIKEYVVRNRTTNVDVDSRGRSCKERMLSVLGELPGTSLKQNLVQFSVTEVTPEELHSFFRQYFEEEVYEDHIKSLVQGSSKRH